MNYVWAQQEMEKRREESETIAAPYRDYLLSTRSAEITVLLLLLPDGNRVVGEGWKIASPKCRIIWWKRASLQPSLSCPPLTLSLSRRLSLPLSLSRSQPVYLSLFYGYINMAINVQAAPFVNTTLHKQKKKRPPSFRFPQRIALTRQS